jgi:hypothetical protein
VPEAIERVHLWVIPQPSEEGVPEPFPRMPSISGSITRNFDRHKPLPNRAAQSRTYGVWFFMRGFPVNGDPKPALQKIFCTYWSLLDDH